MSRLAGWRRLSLRRPRPAGILHDCRRSCVKAACEYCTNQCEIYKNRANLRRYAGTEEPLPTSPGHRDTFRGSWYRGRRGERDHRNPVVPAYFAPSSRNDVSRKTRRGILGRTWPHAGRWPGCGRAPSRTLRSPQRGAAGTAQGCRVVPKAPIIRPTLPCTASNRPVATTGVPSSSTSWNWPLQVAVV